MPNINAGHPRPSVHSRSLAQLVPAKTNIHEREINLAITLVCISVLFVVCQLFKIIPDTYELVSESIGLALHWLPLSGFLLNPSQACPLMLTLVTVKQEPMK